MLQAYHLFTQMYANISYMVSDLTSYPRPNVAVDLVLLTVGNLDADDERRPRLSVVVQRRADGRAVLPGRFVRERRTMIETAAEVLAEKLDIRPRRRLTMTMIDVYDDPSRDDRGWVVSVAYTAVLLQPEVSRLARDRVELMPLHGDAARGRRITPESLAYDHDHMVTTAVRRARRRYERSPDPLDLLRPPYTLSQLRHVHEAVLDTGLKRDTFNRRMLPFLEPALDSRGEEMLRTEAVGRPAQLYRRTSRTERDPEAGPFPLPRSNVR